MKAKLGVGLGGMVVSGAAGGAAAGTVGGVWEEVEAGGGIADVAYSGFRGAVGGVIRGAGIGAVGHGVGRMVGKIKKLPVGVDRGHYPQEVYDKANPKGAMVKTNVFRDDRDNRYVRDWKGKLHKVNYGYMNERDGFARHHKKPLVLGGTDTPDNMMYMDNATHRLSHPGTKIKSDPIGTFYY